MDELDELRKQLQQVQLQSAVKKLSERTCVQIVSQLVEAGQLEVYYTLNGKEYVTPNRLQQEIKDELYVRGGRASANDIQAATNVDSAYINRAVKVLLQEDNTLTQLDGGDLITEAYLDAALEALSQSLETTGQASIGDWAEQLQLPIALTQAAVSKRLGSIIRADQRGAMLYTPSFMQREASRARGAFSAATKPVSIGSVAGSLSFDERMLDSIVRDLISAGSLQGSIRGRDYVPQIFSVFQRMNAETFFRQNEHLPFDRAERMQVSNAFELLKTSFPDCVKLESCVASSSVIGRIVSAAESAVSSNTWTHVSDEFPWMTAHDLSTVLTRSGYIASEWSFTHQTGTDAKPSPAKALLLADGYVVAFGYLDAIVERFKPLAQQQASVALLVLERCESAASGTSAPALARATSTGTMASSMVEDDEEYSIVVTGGGPSKAAKGVSKKSSKATPKPEQSDSEDEGRGRKGGKGKSKKGKRREESSDDEPVKQTAPAKPGKGQTAASKGSAKAAKESDVSVSDDTITTHVLAWDSVGLRDHPELLTAIVKEIASTVRKLYDAAKKSVTTTASAGAAPKRKKWIANLSTRLADVYPTLAMLSRSLEALESVLAEVSSDRLSTAAFTSTMASLHTALLDEYWKPVLLRLLAHQCLLYDVDVPNSAMSAEKPVESEFRGSSSTIPFGGDDEPPIVVGVSLADLASSIRALKASQPDVGAALEALFAEANKRNGKATNLLTQFEKHLDGWQLRLRVTDKKSDKNQCFAWQQSIVKKLSSSASSVEVYQLTLASVFAQAYGIGLCLPPNWPHAIALLTVVAPALSPDQLTALSSFDSSLATYSTPAGSDDDVVGGSGETIESSAESLSVNMEAVRAIGVSRIKPVKSTK